MVTNCPACQTYKPPQLKEKAQARLVLHLLVHTAREHCIIRISWTTHFGKEPLVQFSSILLSARIFLLGYIGMHVFLCKVIISLITASLFGYIWSQAQKCRCYQFPSPQGLYPLTHPQPSFRLLDSPLLLLHYNSVTLELSSPSSLWSQQQPQNACQPLLCLPLHGRWF